MARISFVLLLFAAMAAGQTKPRSAPVPAPAAAQARDFNIDSITVEGNRILSEGAIVRASGLAVGSKGNGAAFDAARDRLLASGYFETVAYRYRPSPSGAYALTFEVQEVTQQFPLRVEGLDAPTGDVVAYLKSRDPLFTGKLPGTEQVLDRTAREIEAFLSARGHQAQVAGKMIATAPGQFEIDFMPKGGLPAVANVTFEGNKLISTTILQNKIAEVAFGQPYTEAGFRLLLDNQIRPLYETKGHLKVVFTRLTTGPSAQVKGVDVKVDVDEGPEYKLARVAVAGRSASESARILKSAKIPQMTIANFDEIRQAAVRVRDSLKHQGFLDAEVTTDRKVDDEKKSAEFFLVVDAGPQYSFGALAVNGLGLDGEAAIRKMWSIKTGDPYPSDYPDYFLAQVKEQGLFDNLGGTEATPKINPETHVVDVALDFSGVPPKPRAPRPPGAPF